MNPMSHTIDRSPNLNRSGMPRYQQLATLFRRRIESGQWKIGEQTPTVDELSAECGVARATIRQAIGLLATEGLVARYRAKGTFVTRRPQDQMWCEVETDWSGLLSSREGAKIEILSRSIVAEPPLRPHDIGKLSSSYRHLRRRHMMNGVPFLVADVYLDAELAKHLPKNALTSKTALRLAASLPGVKIVDAHQTLTIGTADLETAELLQLPLNAAIAHVNRSAVDQHGLLVLARYLSMWYGSTSS